MPKRSKIEKLMDKYPYIRTHYENFYNTHNVSNIVPKINVQRADTSLMHYCPDNATGNISSRFGRSCMITRDGKYEVTLIEKGNCIGEGEFPLFIGAFEDLIAKEGLVYIKHIGTIEPIKYILWIRVLTFYKRERGVCPENIEKIELQYTVYLKPKNMSFIELAEMTDITKNVKLTKRDISKGLANNDPDYERVNENLAFLIRRFEFEVYKKGLNEIVRANKNKSMNGVIGDVSIILYTGLRNQIIVTIGVLNIDTQELDPFFDVIGENPPGFSDFEFFDICATLDEVEELISLIEKEWSKIKPKDRSRVFSVG